MSMEYWDPGAVTGPPLIEYFDAEKEPLPSRGMGRDWRTGEGFSNGLTSADIEYLRHEFQEVTSRAFAEAILAVKECRTEAGFVDGDEAMSAIVVRARGLAL